MYQNNLLLVLYSHINQFLFFASKDVFLSAFLPKHVSKILPCFFLIRNIKGQNYNSLKISIDIIFNYVAQATLDFIKQSKHSGSQAEQSGLKSEPFHQSFFVLGIFKIAR
jgi:hypothetical protein